MKDRIQYTVPPGYFTEAYARLAEQVSMLPPPHTIHLKHPALAPIARLIYLHDGAKPPKIQIENKGGDLLAMNMPRFELSDWKGKRAVVGYSGGKDSVAMAIKMQKAGYKVEAFHVQNLNRSCSDEKQASIETCRLLDIPLTIKSVKTNGPTMRIESPVKNLLVLAMMLDDCGPLGVKTYALGTQVNRKGGVDDFNTNMDFSDSPDVLFIGSELFRQEKGFNLRVGELGKSSIDAYYSMKIVLGHKKGWELLCAYRSCMTQFRFKDMRRKHNEKKYSLKLLPGRCGSCWKCCLEYLVLDAMGAVKSNKGFKEKCFSFIHNQEVDWSKEVSSMLNTAREERRLTCVRAR
jgi:hypothetical protein